jgi:hypothetical protein
MKLSPSEAYPRHNTSVKHRMVAKGANKSSVAARIALGRVQHHKLFAWITIIAKSALDDAAKRIHRLLCGQRITATTPTPQPLCRHHQIDPGGHHLGQPQAETGTGRRR